MCTVLYILILIQPKIYEFYSLSSTGCVATFTWHSCTSSLGDFIVFALIISAFLLYLKEIQYRARNKKSDNIVSLVTVLCRMQKRLFLITGWIFQLFFLNVQLLIYSSSSSTLSSSPTSATSSGFSGGPHKNLLFFSRHTLQLKTPVLLSIHS